MIINSISNTLTAIFSLSLYLHIPYAGLIFLINCTSPFFIHTNASLVLCSSSSALYLCRLAHILPGNLPLTPVCWNCCTCKSMISGPCHHDVARPQFPDKNTPPVWWAAANALNKQSYTATRGGFPASDLFKMLTTSQHKNLPYYETLNKAPDLD